MHADFSKGMRGYAIEDIPVPAGRSGWPWTPPRLAQRETPTGKCWPKITIVTPNLNQGLYLEEAIRSVLLQGYPNLEYFVIDGGSTDDSIDIIAKYEPWLSGWISERDNGQSEAINKGRNYARGEIFNWLCSDDLLAPGALFRVATAFAESPECDIVVGDCYCQFERTPEKNQTAKPAVDVWRETPYLAALWQPSCFFRPWAVKRAELVRKDLHFCMDRELWCYFRARGATWKYCDQTLGIYRYTGDNKSVVGGRKILDEVAEIYRVYGGDRVPLTFWLEKVWLPLVRAHRYHPSSGIRIGSRLLSRSLSLGLRAFYPTERIHKLQREFYMYGAW